MCGTATGNAAILAAIQVDACILNFIIQELFPYRSRENYGLVQRSLESQVVDGYLAIDSTPGLGVTLDEEAISRYPSIRVK